MNKLQSEKLTFRIMHILSGLCKINKCLLETITTKFTMSNYQKVEQSGEMTTTPYVNCPDSTKIHLPGMYSAMMVLWVKVTAPENPLNLSTDEKILIRALLAHVSIHMDLEGNCKLCTQDKQQNVAKGLEQTDL